MENVFKVFYQVLLQNTKVSLEIDYYNWEERKSFIGIATQKCSDMIVQVGELFFVCLINQDRYMGPFK